MHCTNTRQVFAGITVALYFMGLMFPNVGNVLALKATNTYGSHSYIWNIFTAGFFNTNPLIVSLFAQRAFLL